MKKSILIPICVLAAVTLACGFGDIGGMVGLSEPTAVPTEVRLLVDPTSPPQQIPTAEPSQTSKAPLPTQEPTKPPQPTETPSDPVYFREEFESSVNWTYDYIYGNNQEQCGIPDLVEGQLRWSCRSGEESQVRIYEDAHTYTDVALQMEVENFGSNTNWTALMCRVNDDGWIEFRFTTGGLWEIYRFDAGLYHQKKNPYVYIANAATPYMKPGKATNIITMICKGEEFEFFANGKQIELTLTPKSSAEFARQGAGGVGVGFQVMGDNPGSVDVGIEWFETFQP